MLEGFSVTGLVEELPDGDVDPADFLVGGEVALAKELDFEGQAVLARERFVDSELLGYVPRGVGAAVSVDGSLDLLNAGERNDGVHVHLGEEIHVFQILRRSEAEFQRSVFHGDADEGFGEFADERYESEIVCCVGFIFLSITN